jgi:hypothetical protein
MKKNNAAAVELGRLGGLAGGHKGGTNRWKGVTAEERSAILRRASAARWKGGKKKRDGG